MATLAEIFGRIIGDEYTGIRVADYLAENPYAKANELTRFKGVGMTTASTILMVMESSSEYLAGTRAKTITKPEDIIPRISHIRWCDTERFVLITLNGSNNVIGVHEVTKGLVNQTPVAPREVFRIALQDNASSIMLSHNHPSGSTEPSREDEEITRLLVSAGKILKIPVLDHIILSRSGFTSMCRNDPDMFVEK